MWPVNFEIYWSLWAVEERYLFPFLISRILEFVFDGSSCCFGAPCNGGHGGLTAICVQDSDCLRDMPLPRSFLFMLTEGLLSVLIP